MSDSNERFQGAAEPEENSTVVKLSQVYHFEDHDISELDFSGLENITVANMIKANKSLSRSWAIRRFSMQPSSLSPR